MRNRLFLIPVAVLLMSISAESYAFNPIKPFKVNASVHVGAGALSNAADRVSDGYLRGFFYSDGGPKVEALYSERIYVNDELALSARVEAHPFRKFSFGADIWWARIGADIYPGLSDEKCDTRTFNVIHILPEARFYYFQSRFTTLSGAVAAGVGIVTGSNAKCSFDYQITPITYTIGKKVYGLAELSLGSVFMGLNFGFGCRF
ncbi:MAG: hypothetical protein PUH56_07080 [Bacteroidales bacterium]|nr:hypothetical protein [Bacteroidales bacterium]